MGEASNLISMTESARYLQVSRQAVYMALRKKKLAGKKVHGRWYFHYDELNRYRGNKYCRELSWFEGNLLFDKEKGEMSPTKVAEMLNVPVQTIYYAIRIGHLPHNRKGSAYVILDKEAKAYAEKHLQSNDQKTG